MTNWPLWIAVLGASLVIGRYLAISRMGGLPLQLAHGRSLERVLTLRRMRDHFRLCREELLQALTRDPSRGRLVAMFVLALLFAPAWLIVLHGDARQKFIVVQHIVGGAGDSFQNLSSLLRTRTGLAVVAIAVADSIAGLFLLDALGLKRLLWFVDEHNRKKCLIVALVIFCGLLLFSGFLADYRVNLEERAYLEARNRLRPGAVAESISLEQSVPIVAESRRVLIGFAVLFTCLTAVTAIFVFQLVIFIAFGFIWLLEKAILVGAAILCGIFFRRYEERLQELGLAIVGPDYLIEYYGKQLEKLTASEKDTHSTLNEPLPDQPSQTFDFIPPHERASTPGLEEELEERLRASHRRDAGVADSGLEDRLEELSRQLEHEREQEERRRAQAAEDPLGIGQPSGRGVPF